MKLLAHVQCFWQFAISNFPTKCNKQFLSLATRWYINTPGFHI